MKFPPLAFARTVILTGLVALGGSPDLARGDEPELKWRSASDIERRTGEGAVWKLAKVTLMPHEATSVVEQKPPSWTYAIRTTTTRKKGDIEIKREFTSKDGRTVHATEKFSAAYGPPPEQLKPGMMVPLTLSGMMTVSGDTSSYLPSPMRLGIVAREHHGSAERGMGSPKQSIATEPLTQAEPKKLLRLLPTVPKNPLPIIRLSFIAGAGRVVYEYRRNDEPEEPEPAKPRIVELKAFDANPTIVGGGTMLPERLGQKQLMAAEAEREGLVADGVTQLILRAEVSHEVPVVFRLQDDRFGKLKPLLEGKTITVPVGGFLVAPREEDNKFYAFALLTGADSINDPEDLVPDSPVDPPKLRAGQHGPEYRELELEAVPYLKSKPVIEGKLGHSLKLARKPVVLVHGLFSDPFNAWMGSLGRGASLSVLLERAGLVPFLVNYSRSNGGVVSSESWLTDDRRESGFTDNWKHVWESPDGEHRIEQQAGWLKKEHRSSWPWDWGAEDDAPIISEFQKPGVLRIGGIKDALTYFRDDLNIAATQADVVGHSMGGLLARAYASKTYNRTYLRPANFNQGDISRILTISTPHYGSELADLLPILKEGRIEGEAFIAWVRRCVASFFFHNFVASTESKALHDLAPGSAALRQIGETRIPCYAVATQVTDSEMRGDQDDTPGKIRNRTDHDPGRMYAMAYEGIGLLFFHNTGLLDKAIDVRATQWEDGGVPTAYNGQAPGTGLSDGRNIIDFKDGGIDQYKAILRSAIDSGVYYWSALREKSYTQSLKSQIVGTVRIPRGVFDWEEEADFEWEKEEDGGFSPVSWLYSFASTAGVGGDATIAESDKLPGDAPVEAIAMIRALIFHNDPHNDGAVRTVSQFGGLPEGSRKLFKGADAVPHSFAPWEYRVQSHVVKTLRWGDDSFNPSGFGPTSVKMPRYLPDASFVAGRIEGGLAVAWSGMVKEHAEQYSKVADANKCIILARPVNQDSTILIASGAATKGMAIKGKSANWGPQRGFIPVEQRFSKIWKTKTEPTRTEDIKESNMITLEMLKNGRYPYDPEYEDLNGRPFAVRRALTVKVAGEDYEVLVDPLSLASKDPENRLNSEDCVFLYRNGKLFDWRTGTDTQNGKDVPIFDRTIAPEPGTEINQARAKQILATKTPMDVCADGLSEKEVKPFLTADYDLLAIGFHNDGRPGSIPDHVREADFDDLKGYISSRQYSVVKQFNTAAREHARYPAGKLTHHGPEVQYAKSPHVDYPILVCDPGEPNVTGDSQIFAIRMGPIGYRDIHLKRYFSERMADGFTLWPNLVSKGWQWEHFGKYSPVRGYDPRDSPTLKAYVAEQSRPKNEKPVSAFDHLPPAERTPADPEPKPDPPIVKNTQRLAEAGDAVAQANLGDIYHRGKGVAANPGEAFVWYHLAARSGDSRAAALRDEIEKTLSRDQLRIALRRATKIRNTIRGGR